MTIRFVRSVLIVALLLPATGIAQTSDQSPPRTGDYLGETPPGTAAQLFAPGFISTEFHDDGSPVFTPDGKEVYFRIAGNPRSYVFVSNANNGVWSRPCVDSVAERFQFQTSVFSSDGMKRYFSSKRRPDGSRADNYDIFYIERTNGGWSHPMEVKGAINTEFNEVLFSVSRNGTIYFGAEYPRGKGQMDIYSAEAVGGRYPRVKSLEAINTAGLETAAAVAPDESFLVFTSIRGSRNRPRLWISFQDSPGVWSAAIDMGTAVNSGQSDKFASVTPDGRYLFWVSQRSDSNRNPRRVWDIPGFTYPQVAFEGADVYWISAQLVDVIRGRAR